MLVFCHKSYSARRILTIILGGIAVMLASRSSLAKGSIHLSNDRFELSIPVGPDFKVAHDPFGDWLIADVNRGDGVVWTDAPENESDGIYRAKVDLFNATTYDIDLVVLEPRSINTQLFKTEETGLYQSSFGSFHKRSDMRPGDDRLYALVKIRSEMTETIYFGVEGALREQAMFIRR